MTEGSKGLRGLGSTPPTTATRVDLAARLSGGVRGHLAGGAVSVSYHFRPASQIGDVRLGATGIYHQPPNPWIDDGACMLALLDSLLDVGFDAPDQARDGWATHHAVFGSLEAVRVTAA